MAKGKTIVFICLGALVPVGLIVGFSLNWVKEIPISCAGSSSVKPFLDTFAKEFTKNNNDVSITVESGGSGFGIEQVAKNLVNVGTSSKDPYLGVKGDGSEGSGFQEQWEHIKTITLGWEGICPVFIAPESNLFTKNDWARMFDANSSTIQYIYQLFSGWKESGQNQSLDNMTNFISPSMNLTSQQRDFLSKYTFKPFVRTGGSLTSGTAYSFISESRLVSDLNEDGSPTFLTPRQWKSFEFGTYGTSFSLQETGESNTRAWDKFISSYAPGNITYLSTGFITKNWELLQKKNCYLFTYNQNSLVDGEDNLAINNIESGYGWFRPLNIMVDVRENHLTDALKRFIIFLLSNQIDYLSCGAKQVNSIEKDRMFEDENNFVADLNWWKGRAFGYSGDPWGPASNWYNSQPHLSCPPDIQ